MYYTDKLQGQKLNQITTPNSRSGLPNNIARVCKQNRTNKFLKTMYLMEKPDKLPSSGFHHRQPYLQAG